jgi:hypothetical protein
MYGRECVADAGFMQNVRFHLRCAELASVLGYDTDQPWVWDEFRQDAYAYGGAGPFPWEARYYA